MIKRRRRKENSPKMRIFSLIKINSGPEEDVEAIEEAEECGTRSINNNNNINKTFDFIVFATLHNNTDYY